MSLMGNVPDDPYAKPDNKYLCTITQSEGKPTKGNDKYGWNLTFSIVEGDYKSADIFEWKMLCAWDGEKIVEEEVNRRDLSHIKQRMLQLGVSYDIINRWASVQEISDYLPELVGTENVVVTYKNNRIIKVEIDGDLVSGSVSSGSGFLSSM
jgi:hypothetical protein